MKKSLLASVWPRALTVSAITFGLACSGTSLHAQNAPATPPPAPPAQGGTPTPRDGAPRGGEGRGEGRPRGEGGPREGGPRGEGGPGGMRPDETPEQRQQRMLQPYVDIVEDLTPEQKTRIMTILENANQMMQAVRENEDLDPEDRRDLMDQVRADIPPRVIEVLTPAQTTVYKAALEQQAKAAAAMTKVGTLRPNEDVGQMRERVLKGYEDAMEELSVKQKTQIIKILEASGEVMDNIIADTTQTPEQKRVAIDKESQAVSAKVLPMLDADQSKSWKQAHEAKRKAWQQEALAPPAPPATTPPIPPATPAR